MSEPSWQRIEHAVFRELARDATVVGARHAPGRWSWLGVGLTAACAAAVLAVWLVGRSGAEAALAEVATADRGSRFEVDGVALDVAPESKVVARATRGDGLIIELDRGSVRCSVAPRGQRGAVVVDAGRVRVEVVGTEFAVFRDDDSAAVEVYQGVVAVHADGGTTRVEAGGRWPDAHEAAALAEPQTEVADEVAPETPAEDVVEDGVEDGQVAAAGAEQGSAERHRAPHAKRRAAAQSELEAPQAASQPSRSDRFYEAQRLEANQPAAAAAIYGELASGSDAWAANALYARALLALEQGQRDEALRLFHGYLARFPEGANAEDARRQLGPLP